MNDATPVLPAYVKPSRDIRMYKTVFTRSTTVTTRCGLLYRRRRFHADPLDIRGLQTLRARFTVEFHGFAFFQRPESFSDDGIVVDKNFLTAFSANEPKTLLIVKPLDLPLCTAHDLAPMKELSSPKCTNLMPAAPVSGILVNTYC